jgi:DNA uptake protein ComE-like DNA-binding protein
MNPAAESRVPRRAAVATLALLLIVQTGLTVTVVSAVPRPPIAGAGQLRFDPNRASAAELMLLPRIGAKTAANIIAYRSSAPQQPAFRSLADLDAVARIGPATLETLKPFLRFPVDPDPATAPDSP